MICRGFKQEQVPQLSKDTLFVFFAKLNIELKTCTLPSVKATFPEVI